MFVVCYNVRVIQALRLSFLTHVDGSSVQDISTLRTMEMFNELRHTLRALKNCPFPGGIIFTIY
jgi:hypothetical protein